MSQAAFEDYVARFRALLLARKQSTNGALSQSEESRYIEVLDDLWHQLSDQEKKIVESQRFKEFVEVCYDDKQ